MSDASRPKTVVHLLRHGEVYNPTGILYGRRAGFVLSELGEQMADQVATVLAHRDITGVYASPLERAQQTAAPLAREQGLDIVTDERVIESSSEFEGEHFGAGHNALKNPSNWRYLWNPFQPSWGEPYTDIVARMMAAVADVRRANTGHEAVVVSHQLPIWTTRLHVEKRRTFLHDPRSRQCTLCSLTSLTFASDELRVVGYSEPVGDLIPVADRKAPFSAGGAPAEEKPGGTER